MTIIEQRVNNFCSKFKYCYGCPMGTCVAPLSQDYAAFKKWYNQRIESIIRYLDKENK